MHVRMVIGEVTSDRQVGEFKQIVKEHDFNGQGFQGVQQLEEENGRMVIVITSWTTREDCIRYHSSRSYRELVTKTQHLLIGDFVVKMFRME